MSRQMAGECSARPLRSRRWIAQAAPGPEPVEAKWPRRRRYALAIGAPLLFWACVFAALHWG